MGKSTFYIRIVAIALLATVEAAMGGTSSKSIVAAGVSQPPKVDGYLNEREWQSAVPVTSFTQFDPDEGAPATEKTSVRILYDNDAVYVGVMCYDREPDKIVSQLTRRDRTGQSDRISVIIDSYNDRSTAFLFSGTVSGVQSDGVLSQDGRVYDIQWDAVWEFNARIVDSGWSAEFRIPYSALRFSEQEGEYVWGINFRRYIARKFETDEWVSLPRSQTPIGVISPVSTMGNVSGIRNIHPTLHLDILPYLVTKESFFSEPSPFPVQKQFNAPAGADLKYGVTNNFTLDVAVHPDFGQVEVDQAVLNLTVFETYYPEKRPLFLEGSQMFSFGNTFDNDQLYLFYSRRIGRQPTLTPSPDSGYIFTQNPQATDILGAVKFTGKTDNGLTLGVLSALTDREEGIEENASGVRSSPILFEPKGEYSVFRLRQDFQNNSYVGIMAGDVAKEGTLPALSAGADWNLHFLDAKWTCDGYLAGSQAVSKLVESAGQVTGSAGKISIGQIQDEHWVYFTMYDFSTNHFWINDLGFFNRPLEEGGYSQVSYKNNFAAAPLRRYSVSLGGNYRWDWGGTNTMQDGEFSARGDLSNFWSVQLNMNHYFPAFDDANRGIVGLYHRPTKEEMQVLLQTDVRDPYIVQLTSDYLISAKGMHSLTTDLSLTIRPATWMEYTPDISFARVRQEEAWAIGHYTDDGANVFGNRDVDEFSFSLSATITFERNISFQFFTQLFLAKGHYYEFRQMLNPDILLPYNYPAAASYSNPDFNQQIINANMVLRWEYLPGSTLYLVWTQARNGLTDVYDQSFGDNFSGAFRLPMDNVILAKITYLLSL
ncbi:MAG TPA: DUF5916 domain-containing protein [Bacteroidota bacterium]|nr:DUF5916 domain-containing protein [Bacteroidota bacterium]